MTSRLITQEGNQDGDLNEVRGEGGGEGWNSLRSMEKTTGGGQRGNHDWGRWAR